MLTGFAHGNINPPEPGREQGGKRERKRLDELTGIFSRRVVSGPVTRGIVKRYSIQRMRNQVIGRDYMMAEKLEGKEVTTVEELAISNAFQMEAIINVLERKGLLTKSEVLEEILRLRKVK